MTLAQQYIEGHSKRQYRESEVEWTNSFILRRLLMPLPGNEGVTAERFVFEEDAPQKLGSWCQAGMIDWDTAIRTIKQVDMNIWIEYPMFWGPTRASPGKVGFMYGRVEDEERIMIQKPVYVVAIVGADEGTGEMGPQGLLVLPDFPINLDTGCKLIWFQDQIDTRKLDKEQLQMAQDLLGDFLACMFLLQTPKITEKRLSAFGPRKQKVQKQTGKPFVELHRVTIRVGMAEPSYERTGAGTSAGGSTGSKKFHRVMPHFRTYHRDTVNPRIKLVESFWRGDPKKGIILHERSVKIGDKPPRREE